MISSEELAEIKRLAKLPLTHTLCDQLAETKNNLDQESRRLEWMTRQPAKYIIEENGAFAVYIGAARSSEWLPSMRQAIDCSIEREEAYLARTVAT
jgi:hypothetical protein